MKKSVTDIELMSDEALMHCAWELLTNRGMISKKGRALAQRRIRKLGGTFFVSLNSCVAVGFDDDARHFWSSWGFGKPNTSESDCYAIGVTLSHAMHKLGNGCAKIGAKMYFSHS